MGCKPVGLPLASNWLGNSFWNTWRGITLPPAPVSTLQHTFPSQLDPMSAGIFMVVKASFFVLVLMSAIVIYLGSVASHSWSCWSVASSTLTRQVWGHNPFQHLPHLFSCSHITGNCGGSHLASLQCLPVS